MVVRNGYYVWRIGTPNPDIKSILKWQAITWLLTAIRLGNVISGPNRMQALTESMGRIVGWMSLLINKPRPH